MPHEMLLHPVNFLKAGGAILLRHMSLAGHPGICLNPPDQTPSHALLNNLRFAVRTPLVLAAGLACADDTLLPTLTRQQIWGTPIIKDGRACCW